MAFDHRSSETARPAAIRQRSAEIRVSPAEIRVSPGEMRVSPAEIRVSPAAFWVSAVRAPRKEPRAEGGSRLRTRMSPAGPCTSRAVCVPKYLCGATNFVRHLTNFRPSVLGCIDASDSESKRIFQHFPRSTRFKKPLHRSRVQTQKFAIF